MLVKIKTQGKLYFIVNDAKHRKTATQSFVFSKSQNITEITTLELM